MRLDRTSFDVLLRTSRFLSSKLDVGARKGLSSNNKKPFGHHTLGKECKGVLFNGVDRMLVENRVGVGLTLSTISSFAPIYISHHGSKKTVVMAVSPPWWELGVLGSTQDGESYYFSHAQ